MKSKIAGLFRSLTRSKESSAPTPFTAPPAIQTPVGAPASQTAPAAAGKRTFAPTQMTAAQMTAVDASELLELPLAPVIATLPMDLKAKLIGAPPAGQMIFVPTETVVSQLAFGIVKITFGELRHLAPGIFVKTPGEHDQRPVILPLQEILARINSTLISRRPAQQVEVSEEIVGPFSGRGRGISFTAQPVKTPPPPTATPAPTMARQTTPVAAPAHSPTAVPAREIKPTPPVNLAPPAPPSLPSSAPIAFPNRQTSPLTAPIPFAEPSKPAANDSNGSNSGSNGNHDSNGHGSNGSMSFKFSAAPVPTPVAPASTPPKSAVPAPSAEAQLTLSIALNSLTESWPDEIKSEMAQGGFTNLIVALPVSIVEPGLKSGRITVSWKNLRTLAKPGSPVSPNDELLLDLPLKVIAPAFLVAQKNRNGAKAKVTVSSEIPNLFFGFPQPVAEPVAPPPAPAPVPLPVAPPLQKVSDEPKPVVVKTASFNPQLQKAADTNFFTPSAVGAAAADEAALFQRTPLPATDFLSRQTHPKEVVATAMKLPGVAGAVVAIADGLRVAGEVPAGMNPDAVAAFLPQIYERVNQSTRELRMGALNNVGFTVGNVPWKIFRVNSVYFAAFGRAGEPLPKPQLAALAAGLDRKNK